MRRGYRLLSAALAALLLLATTGSAAITAKYPLENLVGDADFVLVAHVTALDAEGKSLVLVVDEALKGKAPFTRLPLAVKGDGEAEKGKHLPLFFKRVRNDTPVVLFLLRNDNDYAALAYSNGTWFQVFGVKPEGADGYRWSFTHLEPLMRRTFTGTTPEMKAAVKEGLATMKWPPFKKDEAAGFGPEEPEKKGEPEAVRLRIAAGPVFGVVPSVFLLGPLSLLAMLFPTLFGGVKRWMTVMTTACTTSSIYFLWWLFGDHLLHTPFGGPAPLWALLTVINLLGLVWAWQRHVSRVESGEAPPVPGKVELIVLLILSVVGAGSVGYAVYAKQPLLEPAWMLTETLAVGAWTATLFVLWKRWTFKETGRRPALAAEAVMLLGMTLSSIALAGALTPTRTVALQNAEVGKGQAAVLDDLPIHPAQMIWQHTLPGVRANFSAPLIVGDRLYVAGANQSAFDAKDLGVLFCLKTTDGSDLASSRDRIKNKNKNLRPVAISSPFHANGKLFLGEGFHKDSKCNLYCLDAETCAEVWRCPTESHTESSPCVVDGKVFFGAGDDGVFAVAEKTGEKLWNRPGYHVDASPVVVGKRLYVGSGVGDVYKKTALLCLDAASGEPLWTKEIDLPAWGSPTVVGDRVYFGIGNGDFLTTDDHPAGAILCVRADNGEEVWRFPVGDGVLARPTLDRSCVYCGSRDGTFYCLDRRTGLLVWKRVLGSPITGSAVLARSGPAHLTTGVYVVSSGGQVFCLGPKTGKLFWTENLSEREQGKHVDLFAAPALTVTPDEHGETRRLYVSGTLAEKEARVYCFEDRLEARSKDEPSESRP